MVYKFVTVQYNLGTNCWYFERQTPATVHGSKRGIAVPQCAAW